MKTRILLLLAVLFNTSVFAESQNQNYALVEVWEESSPPLKQGGDGTANLIEWSLRSTSIVRATACLLDRDSKNSAEKQKETERILSTVKVQETQPSSRIFKVWLDTDESPSDGEMVDMLLRTLIASKSLEDMKGATHPYKFVILSKAKK